MIKFKKINYRHYIAIAITISFLLCSVFIYQNSFTRIIESFIDIWNSIKYYFAKLTSIMQDIDFEESLINVTVTEKSKVDISFLFPEDFESFKERLSATFQLFFTIENFALYLKSSLKSLIFVYTFIFLIVLILFIIKFYLDGVLNRSNNRYNDDSISVKAFKRLEDFFLPVKTFFIELYRFLFPSFYSKLWLLIWLYNLNVITVIIEFFAYVLYFALSINVTSLFMQIYKLFFDLTLTYTGLPLYIWLIVIVVVLCIIRRNLAFKKLEHLEAYDTGFVKSLPTLNLIHGWMGAGKGQVMTDMVLTKVKTYRSETLDTMFKYDLMFPHFPWITFEKTLLKLKEEHKIYDLARIERYINAREKKFNEYVSKNKIEYARRLLYGYDFEKYHIEYDNNLYMVSIWDALKEYGMAYYIYTMAELIVSNYAIRSDGIMYDEGNFPIWDYNFFNRKSKDLNEISSYGKILDQDTMRKGKKMIKDNPFADTLEFGVTVFAELDKERGNQFVTNEMKRSSDETNQKNDLFNYGLKMDRHPSTVDFKHYLNIFFDLQRLGSTNADLQECGQHIGIGKKDSGLLAIPLFFIEEFIYGLFADKFQSLYYDYRYSRGDNTILMYVIKKYCGKFVNYYNKTYNLFGYDKYTLLVEDPTYKTQNEHPYYLTYKKSHANRYCTDSFVDCFRQATLKRNVGMVDYPEYKGVKATIDELKMQNSYFYNDLTNMFVEEKEDVSEEETPDKNITKLKFKKE